MPVKVEIPYSNTWESPYDVKRTFAYFADLERALPNNFPGVERFEVLSPGIYRWTFEKLSYGSHHLAFKLVTRLETKEEESLSLTPVEEPGASRLTGTWRFRDLGGKTGVAFDAIWNWSFPSPHF